MANPPIPCDGISVAAPSIGVTIAIDASADLIWSISQVETQSVSLVDWT